MKASIAVLIAATVAAAPVLASAQTTDRPTGTAVQPAASELAATGWSDRIRPGRTLIKASHFLELRQRIAALRLREGLAPVAWTDPVLTAGVTPVKSVHLLELRAALDAVYDTIGQPRPTYIDKTVTPGRTVVRAAHILQLREAVEVLENPLPSLVQHYERIPPSIIDPGYMPDSDFVVFADLDGDGNDDLIVLGADYSSDDYRPRPGRVYVGDGEGGFGRAPSDLFPVDTLNTVHPRNVPFGDLNGDGRLDMFVAAHGWDFDPWPGEQNRLYLSRPDGGWRDATDELPQLSDYSHSAAIGDIRGRGVMDIVVGNGYGGQHKIRPYVLLNDGGGSFLLDRTVLPEVIGFPASVLADLNRDGLPELILTADRSADFHNQQSVVFWNHSGAFSEQHKTPLPAPRPFVDTHIDLDAVGVDADGDGLVDLLVVGTQGDPYYDGWFVQLLMNNGNGTFIDETASRLQPHESFGGIVGEETGAPWAQWVRVLDFNGDGMPDFTVDPFWHDLWPPPPNHPLIWLNDGHGNFAALKVRDFVDPGDEWLVASTSNLIETRHGYSFIVADAGSDGFFVTGLLATRANR